MSFRRQNNTSEQQDLLSECVRCKLKLRVAVETIQSHADLFGEATPSMPPSAHSADGTAPPFLERRHSNQSIISQMSGNAELSIATITASECRKQDECSTCHWPRSFKLAGAVATEMFI